MGNLTFATLSDGDSARPKRGFWDSVGHFLFHTKKRGGLSDGVMNKTDFSALEDCGCIEPEALSDGKGRGVKMPKPEDIARAKKLNHRFAKFRSQLGATYRAFCGGRDGFMIKRYVESCLADGTPTVNTTNMKPIGVGPASLANFEKWHGISFHQFETADESEVAKKLKAHNAKVPAPVKGGAKTPKAAVAAVQEVKKIVAEAEEVVEEKQEVIEKAKEKIAKVRKERKKKEVSPAKAEAVIEHLEQVIEEAQEEIAEVKAEAKEEIAEVKQEVKTSSGGGDKVAQMMAMMSQFNSTVEAL